MENNKIVQIKWLEASRVNGRVTKIERAELTGVTTVGYVIEDTENALVVCQSLLSGAADNLIVIPRVSILELTYLAEEINDAGESDADTTTE